MRPTLKRERQGEKREFFFLNCEQSAAKGNFSKKENVGIARVSAPLPHSMSSIFPSCHHPLVPCRSARYLVIIIRNKEKNENFEKGRENPSSRASHTIVHFYNRMATSIATFYSRISPHSP